MSYLYIFYIKPLSINSFENIFSHTVGCLFIFAVVSFDVQKLLSLIRSHLFIFIFIAFTEASMVAQLVKNLPAVQETWTLISGLGRSPGEGNGNPLQYFCLEKPMDRGDWQAKIHGVADSDTTEQLAVSLSLLL